MVTTAKGDDDPDVEQGVNWRCAMDGIKKEGTLGDKSALGAPNDGESDNDES